jgi:hypothetical protein
MPDEREGLGLFSLQAVMAGLALPLVLVILFAGLLGDKGVSRPLLVAYLLAGLFGVLELLALAAGLAGWSSRAGKLGAILALVFLLAASAATGWCLLGGRCCETGPVGPAAVPEALPGREPPEMTPAPAPGGEPSKGGGTGELFPNVPAR